MTDKLLWWVSVNIIRQSKVHGYGRMRENLQKYESV